MPLGARYARSTTRSKTGPAMRLVLLFCISILLAVGPAALADDRDPPEYTEAVKLGVAEFADKNFDEARSQFARAHSLYPNARTLRALGMVEFELKNYVESTHYLSEALSSQEKPLDPDKRTQTEQLLKRAQGYIARYTLDIEPGTTVRVDGSLAQVSPGGELVLEVGDHVLEFRAPGRIADKRRLNVQGGEQKMVRVVLAPIGDESVPTQTPAPGETPRERRAYRNPWLWTVLSVVVAGAAAGTAVALTRDPPTKTEGPYTGTGGAPALGAP